MNKEELIPYLRNVSVILVSAVVFLFPLFFLTLTTDFFILPKQLFVIFATLVALIIWGARSVLEKRITFRVAPFNLPMLLFGIAILISALMAPDRYDSIFQSTPLVALVLLYFVVINSVWDKASFAFVSSSLILGSALSSLISILYYFKIYVLPFPAIQSQYFSPLGAIIQQAVYLLPILIFIVVTISRKLKKRNDLKLDPEFVLMGVSGLVIFTGLILVIYQIFFAPQKPIILPFQFGFQIALAGLSQDTNRLIQSFLAGSGYGTFITDFTRFKMQSFNQEPNIWNLVFSYSSSYFLELIATTGILGAVTFLFLIVKFVKTKTSAITPLYIAVVSSFILAFLLPFTFSAVFLLVMLIALYASYLYTTGDKRIDNVNVSLVALREGLLSFEEIQNAEREKTRKSDSAALPVVALVVILLISGFVAYFAGRLLLSDVKMTESLTAANLNNANKSYDLQRQAISAFPYRSDYYTIFSRLNLALANSLASSIPANSSPSAQTQQTIVALLQQSINSARTSVTIAPNLQSNWLNLSQIYRNLINVGQNAEQFAIVALQQAMALDPYNPQLYIELGGIYYQLGNYDAAQNQFQIATRLKPDLANAYYNLGHTLEAKKDLNGALQNYLTVRELVKNNKQDLARIDAEVSALEKKIGQAPSTNTNVSATKSNQPPLEVNSPQTSLPKQNPPVKISPPPSASSSSK